MKSDDSTPVDDLIYELAGACLEEVLHGTKGHDPEDHTCAEVLRDAVRKALADARDEALNEAAFIARHAKGPWNAMHVEALEAAQKAVLALKGKPYLAAAHPEGKA